MEQKTKRIGLVGLALMGVAILGGCSDSYRGTYKGYSVEKKCRENYSSLMVYENGKNKGYIKASDSGSDGRYDEIELKGIIKGSEIEKLASLETIQEIDQQLKATVEKVEENKR